MYRIVASAALPVRDGFVEISFRDTAKWGPFLDGASLVVLFGDADAGPAAFLSSFPPSTTQMEMSFAHAHPSDSWRVSVLGTTNMGRDAYTSGQFRFQDGGVPYPADNAAWGPDGGFGLVLFGDRRGFPIRPVNKELAARVIPEQRRIGKVLGVVEHDPCPGAPAIVTTLGRTRRGQLRGGFDETGSWEALDEGVTTSMALLGDRECGPVVLLFDAQPGAVAIPAGTVETEILHVIVEGSAAIGGANLEVGDVRLQQAGIAAPAWSPVRPGCATSRSSATGDG